VSQGIQNAALAEETIVLTATATHTSFTLTIYNKNVAASRNWIFSFALLGIIA